VGSKARKLKAGLGAAVCAYMGGVGRNRWKKGVAGKEGKGRGERGERKEV